MLFNSYVFIFLFLPAALWIFFQLGKRGHYRSAIGSIVLFSFFFYGWWDPRYLWLIGSSMVFNYAFGILLIQYAKTSRGKIFLCLSVTANLALVGYYKYANFFVDNLNAIAETSFHLQTIVLPLGISFFTFTQIAYLVDTYRGEIKEYNFLDYCLFVIFFPHLIAGPIIHHKDIIPQFEQKRIFRFNWGHFTVGLSIFIIGLYKKVVLADGVAFFASYVFGLADKGVELSIYKAWGGALAYTLQLYFDFSGYSDMAIGLARMFGIFFPQNFNSPYKAVNIIEFWRRWHMTLSRFLRDYLYFTLGGNRLGTSRRYTNIFITMLLGGIWHGAGWTFVAWGALHGIYLMVNHAWQRACRPSAGSEKRGTKLSTAASTLFTFLLVVVGWIFFRAENFESALAILKGMTSFGNVTFTVADLRNWWGPILWISMLLGVVWFLPNTQEIVSQFRPALDFVQEARATPKALAWHPNLTWSLLISFAFLTAVMHLSQITAFLYFQF